MSFQTVRGMRDFLPEQAKKKQFIEDTCRRIFERYGFEPLQSPVLEDFALLAAKGSGGEAVKDEIYYFKDKGERELGLRYDLTVPLARIVAANPVVQKPFRRYCIGTAYRYDRPQANRYREFTQADIDIVGAKSVVADFECIQVATDVMRSLGLEFKIKVNNRMLLEELAKKCGIANVQVKEAFRIIDKLVKIGEKEVRAEFKAKGIDGTLISKISTNSFEDVKDLAWDKQGFKELEKLLTLSKENEIPEVMFELSLARGLDYYTGNVFEISIEGGPSVGGGGRYDRLIELYGGPPTPAVGISFGVDRLFDTLEKTLVIEANTDLFIAPLSDECAAEATKLAARLRKNGMAVEIDVMQRNVKKNIEYLNKRGIGFLIVLGENELRAGKVKVKDMGNGEEREFGIGDALGISDFAGK